MDSLVIFRKSASHRTDSRPSPRPHRLMMSPRVVETGSLVTPVVTQPRSPRKGRTHQAVQAEPAPTELVSFVELYRELCCADSHHPPDDVPFTCHRPTAAVVDAPPQRYPRADLMLEFRYDPPPAPLVPHTAAVYMQRSYGRDYQHSFM